MAAQSEVWLVGWATLPVKDGSKLKATDVGRLTGKLLDNATELPVNNPPPSDESESRM